MPKMFTKLLLRKGKTTTKKYYIFFKNIWIMEKKNFKKYIFYVFKETFSKNNNKKPI